MPNMVIKDRRGPMEDVRIHFPRLFQFGFPAVTAGMDAGENTGLVSKNTRSNPNHNPNPNPNESELHLAKTTHINVHLFFTLTLTVSLILPLILTLTLT